VTDTLERVDWHHLDDAYQAYLDAVPDPPWGSLMAQTIVTGPHRRSLFASLAVEPGWTVLDLGTGFGPIPIELAHVAAIRAIGIDVDRRLLEVALDTAGALDVAGWRAPGASVEFIAAGGEAVPLPDDSVDLVTARLLFQHVPAPGAIMNEARRVLRGGGRFVIYDVDDGLSATWPPESPETARLDAAYAAMQSRRGGDREIGRKLPALLAAAGFRIEQICVLPQASFAASAPDDVFRQVTAARYLADREAMIATGLVDRAGFDRCLESFANEAGVARCRFESQVAVVAAKPLAG
jgi:ubiquinone/menaquinone biosynthesis C-methylase UbiE